jgi:hypothetical protein
MASPPQLETGGDIALRPIRDSTLFTALGNSFSLTRANPSKSIRQSSSGTPT